jgi:tetratricopeptide (TPR) repeat protein
MAGMILVYKNEDSEGDVDQDEMRRARKYLKKAIRANPNDMSSHFYYAETYYLSGKAPSGQGLASAETALDYYRATQFVDSNLMLANVLLLGGKTEMVSKAIDRVFVWSGSGTSMMNANEMRRELDEMAAQ